MPLFHVSTQHGRGTHFICPIPIEAVDSERAAERRIAQLANGPTGKDNVTAIAVIREGAEVPVIFRTELVVRSDLRVQGKI